MTNLVNSFEKYAAKRMTMKRFAAENGLKISIAVILKLTANIISMYAAYTFVHFIAAKYTPYPVFFALFALVLIEVFSNAFLFHAYKYTFRGKYSKAAFELLVFAAIFSLSVYTSTKGVVITETNKVNPIELADSITRANIAETSEMYNQKISALGEQATLIRANPTIWTGSGKRDGLSAEQLTELAAIRTQTDSLIDARHAAFEVIWANKENLVIEYSQQAEFDSKDGVNVIYGALFFQVLGSLYLVFAYYKSTTENDLTDFIKQDITDVATNLVGNTVDAFKSMYSDIDNAFLQSTHEAKAKALSIIASNNTPQVQSENNAPTPPEPEMPEPKTETDTPTPKRTIKGFAPDAKKNHNTTDNEVSNDNDTDHNHENRTTKIVNENRVQPLQGVRICENALCQRQYTPNHHKQLYCCDNCRQSAYNQRHGVSRYDVPAHNNPDKAGYQPELDVLRNK
jgi:hypothetical protein